MAKIGIHGFGRIGRITLKAAIGKGLWIPASISDIRDSETFAALFEVDSTATTAALAPSRSAPTTVTA